MGSGYNMTTVKYDSNGVLQWANTHPGSNSYTNRASSVATDIKGNIYVAGRNSGYSTVLVYRPNGTLKWDSNTSPNPIGGKLGTIRVNELGTKVYVAGIGNRTFQMSQFTRTPTKSNLKLKLYMEGLYYPLFNQHSRAETVRIYLRGISYPFEFVDSAIVALDSIGFIARATFNDLEADNYYVVVNHFQSLETWCKSGGVYINNSNDTTFFDFSTSASQAFGSNLKVKSGKYCIIPGDLSQDGYIDGTDFLVIDNDAYNFSTGRYLLSDLNGDNFSDAQDMVIADYNRSREVIRP